VAVAVCRDDACDGQAAGPRRGPAPSGWWPRGPLKMDPARSVRPAERRSHSSKSPAQIPGRTSPSQAMHSGRGAPFELGQAVPELPAGADTPPWKHLVQVALRGPGLMNISAPISGLAWPSAACTSGTVRPRACRRCACAPSRLSLGASGGPRSANAAAQAGRISWAARRCSRNSTRCCSRRSQSPYTRWTRAR